MVQHRGEIEPHVTVPEFRYTKFYTCCVYMHRMPVLQKWTAIFEPANYDLELQVMSCTNMEFIMKMDNCILA